MQVLVEHDPRADVYRVWCWDKVGSKYVSYFTRRGVLIAEEENIHSEGEDLRSLPPTFTIPYEAAEALSDAFIGRSVSAVATDALDDTRKVRDRLFTLVERLAGGSCGC